MQYFSGLSIGILTMLCSALAFSAETDAHQDVIHVNPALTVSDVLQAAIKHQPQQANVQSLQYGVKARRSLANSTLPQAPALTLYHQNDALGSGRNERDFQASLELPLWLPNQRAARTKLAEASQHAYEASQSSLSIQAAGLLREALWEIVYRKNEVAIAQAKHQSAITLQEKVNKSVLAGEAAKTDLLLAQQETLMAEKNAMLAEAEVMHALFRYQLLTGLDEMPAQFEEAKTTLTHFAQSPFWLETMANVDYAEQARKLANIEKKENIQLLVNARSSQGAFDTQYNQSMGLSVRIPFGTAARTAPIVAASEMAYGQALSAREALRMTLEAALHEADHNLEVSAQALTLAEQHHAIASESLRLAEKAYALGEHDLATLVRIKSQAFDAERHYRATQIQHQWNIARYNQAVGVLP